MAYEVEKVIPYHPDLPKHGQVARMFNEIAPNYDKLSDTLSLGFKNYWKYDAVIASFGIRNFDNIDKSFQEIHPRGRDSLHGRKTYFCFHGFMIETQRTNSRLSNLKVPQKIVSSTFRLNSTRVAIYSFIPSMEYTLPFTHLPKATPPNVANPIVRTHFTVIH